MAVVAAGVAAGVAAACGDGSPPGSVPEVERVVVGDTTRVHSGNAAEGDTARLVATDRTGQAQGPPEGLLYNVRAFAVGEDGQIVVADGAGLRRFGADGRFVERVAGEGQGPGEVGSVEDLVFDAAGVLYALDPGNARINLYFPDGTRDHVRLPGSVALWRTRSLAVPEPGVILTDMGPPLAETPVTYPRPIYVALSRDGSVVDTVTVPERLARDCPTRSSLRWRAGWFEDIRHSHYPKVKWAVSSDGMIAVGCPGDYAFEIWRPDGRVLRVSRAYEPLPVSRAEARWFMETRTFEQRRSGLSPEWTWRGPDPPPERPAYDELIFGEGGRIWVRPAHPWREEPTPEPLIRAGFGPTHWREVESRVLDVFEPDGTYRGVVALPPELVYEYSPGRPSIRMRGDTVWAVSRDEVDREYITRYVVDWR